MKSHSIIKLSFLVVLLLLFTYNQVFSQNFDYKALRSIENTRSPFSTGLLKGFSTSAYVMSPAVPIGFLTVGLTTKNNDFLIAGAQSCAGILLTTGITYGLKRIFKRTRPYDKYQLDLTPLQFESSFSMPSGHSSTAFATATTLSLQFRKWYVTVPAFLWAATVAYSRMYLGVHYPSDVLVGILVGVGTAFLTYKLQQYLAPKVSVPLTFKF